MEAALNLHVSGSMGLFQEKRGSQYNAVGDFEMKFLLLLEMSWAALFTPVDRWMTCLKETQWHDSII